MSARSTAAARAREKAMNGRPRFRGDDYFRPSYSVDSSATIRISGASRSTTRVRSIRRLVRRGRVARVSTPNRANRNSSLGVVRLSAKLGAHCGGFQYKLAKLLVRKLHWDTHRNFGFPVESFQ